MPIVSFAVAPHAVLDIAWHMENLQVCRQRLVCRMSSKAVDGDTK